MKQVSMPGAQPSFSGGGLRQSIVWLAVDLFSMLTIRGAKQRYVAGKRNL